MRKFWKKATAKLNVTIAQAPPFQTPSISTTATTALSSTATDSALANASPILAILKDGGEMLKDVPHLKAIAGILHTVFKIWEEIKNVDSLTEELLKSIQRRSEKLVKSLQKVTKRGNGRLKALEEELGEYKTLLESIVVDLQAMQEFGSVKRWLERGESRERIHRYLRRLGEFDSTFTVAALTEILGLMMDNYQWKGSPRDTGEALFQDGQPPLPHLVLGRDSELEAIRQTLLTHSTPRVAILGPGGMGKTTLAQQIMNDFEVLSKFPTPLFVSCENSISVIPILQNIADVLHIPVDERGSALRTTVLKYLRSHRGFLLCLDNFEDPWDPPASRCDVEELLAALNSIQDIGIIVTMRGAERPRGLRWTHPMPAPLEPLSDKAALALFKEVSYCFEEGARELVSAVENVPLAIKLLGRLVEEEGLVYVLQQWEKEGLTVMDRGDKSDGRTTSVTVSISLSLKSPRISSIPCIREVLGILAVLPDGLSSTMLDALQANLGANIDLCRILQALRRVALCYQDSNGRYRLLAPIRQHIQRCLPIDPSILDDVRSTFFDHVIGTNTSHHDAVVPEMANTRSFIVSESTTWNETRVLACTYYLWWEHRTLGICDTAMALVALTHADTPILQVTCRLRVAQLFGFASQHARAHEHLFPALSIVTENPYWEGRVKLEIGGIERMLNKYEEAETFLRQAVNLFKKANNLSWEGVAFESLGTLLSDWGRTSEAEEPLFQSLKLARKMGNRHGEGSALCALGEVYRMTDRIADAQNALVQAIDCYQCSHSVHDEALALRSLGKVQLATGHFEDAERSLLTSCDLSMRIRDSQGKADALQWLGLVYSQMDGGPGLAETHFNNALVISQQILSMDNQACLHNNLGILSFQQGRSPKAITHWVISIAFRLRRLHKSRWKRVVPICTDIQEAELEEESSLGTKLPTKRRDNVYVGAPCGGELQLLQQP